MPYTRIMSLKHTDKLGESLSRVYSDPFELNTAALHLKEYIQGHYDAAARSPYTFTEVTKDRLLKGKRMGMIGQRAWPSHAKEVLEPHGLTEVIVTDSGNWVAVVRFVDDQEEVMYIIPQDKTVLFPDNPTTTPPQVQGIQAAAKYMLQGRCHFCGKGSQGEQAQLMSCAICKIGKYCDATCQRQDWPVHKLVCKELKEMRKATTAS
eukprot:jgi/Chrzof1/12578/UNPLg00531.t1